MTDVTRLEVPASAAAERLDKFLAARLEGVTRSEIKRWIEEGRVLVDGHVRRPRDPVSAAAVVEVRPGPALSSSAEPDPSVIVDVVYEDDHLIVVNKPPGLVVHPGRGHATGTLVNGLLARPGFQRPPSDPRDPEGPLRPGIVHRIDKGTSGILVVAKDTPTREGLKDQLAGHSVERVYRALTVGVPEAGTISTLHGRDPRSRLKFSSRVPRGRRAITHLSLLENLAGGQAALVECRLETGRTHQIRVHLSVERNTPIVADDLYGGFRGAPRVRASAERLGRPALHAAVLGFVHPVTGKTLRFEAPLPPDMQQALTHLRA